MASFLAASEDRSHPGQSVQFPQGAWDVVDYSQAESAVETLRATAELAVDLEADALHAFRSRLCFIQVGTDDEVYLFDTLATGVQPAILKPLLENSAVTKYFHAAGGDLIYLAEAGIRVRGLFDTHRAATLLGWRKLGLSDLAHDLLAIELPKHHQQSDFSRRPLPPDVRDYIANDVRFLCEIGRRVRQACVEKDILEEVSIDCQRLADEAAGRPPIGAEYRPGVGNANLLPAELALRLAIATELHRLRLEWAERVNIPYGRMLSNAAIAEIAQRQPSNLKQLKSCPGVRGGLVREQGTAILSALASLRERSARGELEAPSSEKSSGDSKRRRLVERLKAFRAERAAARGVTPSIVLTNALAEALAAHPPETMAELAEFPYLGPKRFGLYGQQLLQLLQG